MNAARQLREAARWDRDDLIRRVIKALDAAFEVVQTIEHDGRPDAADAHATRDAIGVPTEKIVAETAMLLLCAAPVRRLHERIHDRIDSIAVRLVRHARSERVLAAICLDPGFARDHAVAHAILSRLGHTDPAADRLLQQSLAMGARFGPERLPHRRLEQEWLARVWPTGDEGVRREARLLASSMLGRPMDALGSARLDVYAYTHAVMYATDLGTRRIVLPRSARAVAADADAALAFSLDANDCDLTAEVLLTWPMLGRAWSPAGVFAFDVLTRIEDGLGFLPGSSFTLTAYQALPDDDQRRRFALLSSYHTMYVMGFLCAAALRYGCSPPATIPPAAVSTGAGAVLFRLIDRDAAGASDGAVAPWRGAFDLLDGRQQDSLAPLLLALLLRRARARCDLRLVKEALEMALAHHVLEGPAPAQAAALLRRGRLLGEAQCADGARRKSPPTNGDPAHLSSWRCCLSDRPRPPGCP